jgi:hypothetical protein
VVVLVVAVVSGISVVVGVVTVEMVVLLVGTLVVLVLLDVLPFSTGNDATSGPLEHAPPTTSTATAMARTAGHRVAVPPVR